MYDYTIIYRDHRDLGQIGSLQSNSPSCILGLGVTYISYTKSCHVWSVAESDDESSRDSPESPLELLESGSSEIRDSLLTKWLVMPLLYSLLSSCSRIPLWAMAVKSGSQSSWDSSIVMAMFDSPSNIESTVNMLGRISILAWMHMRAVSSVRWTSIFSSAVVTRSSGSRRSTILSSRCSFHACIDTLWEFATKFFENCLH